jgi:hypothetical protein
MRFELDQAIAVLARTPAVMRASLDGLPASWLTGNEGASTWSPYDVIGHLIHGEKTDWIPRARIILESGPARPFDPFDREAMLRLDRTRPLGELLGEFTALRAANLDTLRGWKLTAADLAKPGAHPSLGAVTLAQLLATWVVHDLDHVVQVARVMAKQYTAEVGPWTAYLSVLRDRIK